MLEELWNESAPHQVQHTSFARIGSPALKAHPDGMCKSESAMSILRFISDDVH
jgi:hypothetical protein